MQNTRQHSEERRERKMPRRQRGAGVYPTPAEEEDDADMEVEPTPVWVPSTQMDPTQLEETPVLQLEVSRGRGTERSRAADETQPGEDRGRSRSRTLG
eukprot:6179825-Amphidinium_carterae.1